MGVFGVGKLRQTCRLEGVLNFHRVLFSLYQGLSVKPIHVWGFVFAVYFWQIQGRGVCELTIFFLNFRYTVTALWKNGVICITSCVINIQSMSQRKDMTSENFFLTKTLCKSMRNPTKVNLDLYNVQKIPHITNFQVNVSQNSSDNAGKGKFRIRQWFI